MRSLAIAAILAFLAAHRSSMFGSFGRERSVRREGRNGKEAGQVIHAILRCTAANAEQGSRLPPDAFGLLPNRSGPMTRDRDTTGPTIEPRCPTQQQAAAYCGLAPSGFAAWQRQGIVPGPIPGTKRWDRHALDAALDKASGLGEALAKPEDPWDAWERERDAAKSAGAR